MVHVESYGRDIDFDGEPARLTVVIDVTARKEAERLNQRLVETSQDLVFVTDGRAKLILVSPSVTRILGWSPEEMIGRNTADFIAPEDLEAARQEFKQVRRGQPDRQFPIAPPAQGRPHSSRWPGWACGPRSITVTTWSAAT